MHTPGSTVYHKRTRYTVLALGQDRQGVTILQLAFTCATNGKWVGQWAGAVPAHECDPIKV